MQKVNCITYNIQFTISIYVIPDYIGYTDQYEYEFKNSLIIIHLFII